MTIRDTPLSRGDSGPQASADDLRRLLACAGENVRDGQRPALAVRRSSL